MPGLERNYIAYGLMSDGVASELVKKFFFTSGKAARSKKSARSGEEDSEDETVEVHIPEVSCLVASSSKIEKTLFATGITFCRAF